LPNQSTTRETLRNSIARNLGAARPTRGIATGSGTATTILDTTLRGGDNDWNGSWIVFTSGSNDGEIRRVSDFEASTGTLTILATPSALSSTAASDQYEIWSGDYPPQDIHDAINDAIRSVSARYLDPTEDLSLHFDKRTHRFDIPSTFARVSDIFYRRAVEGVEVHAFERLFDETTDASWTQALDTKDYREGASLKITVAVGASAGDVVTDSIESTDMSGMTHLEGWIKSTTALTAADYKIHLDSGVVQADGTDLESLNMPGVSADTWTYFRVALAAPESDTAIVSIGIEMDQDKGAHTVHFDRCRGINQDSEDWAVVPRHLYDIERENSDIVLSDAGVMVAGYAPMKIVGGDEPALLTADSTVTEVDSQFIVFWATGLLLAVPGRRGDAKALSGGWVGLAQQRKKVFPPLNGARRVS
jgi:hypothetical protein